MYVWGNSILRLVAAKGCAELKPRRPAAPSDMAALLEFNGRSYEGA